MIELKPNVHKVQRDMRANDVLFTYHASDVHFDSKNCHRDLFKKHLTHTQEKEGLCFIYGDLFDVMGTWRDPRSKPSDIRPEYFSQKPYLDSVVEDAFEFLRPFKNTVVLIGRGNHETNIQRRHDTDILDRLAFMLRGDGGVTVTGGYSGYVIYNFRFSKNYNSTNRLAYHHGGGGNASRSKGILHSQIDAMMYSDADVIVSGHDHNKLHDPSNVSFSCDAKGNIKHRRIDWIKLGSYKRDDETPLMGGYEVEKKYTPKAMGGYFMEFKCVGGHNNYEIERLIYPAQ